MNQSRHLAKVENLILESLMQRGYSKGEAELILSKVSTPQPFDGPGTTPPPGATGSKILMPFGKFRGWQLKDIDTQYLMWISSQEWAQVKFEGLIREIDAEINDRKINGRF